MFANTKSFSSFSVNDIHKAKTFYEETLGLEVTQDNEMIGILTLHMHSGGKIMIYPKPDHEPATFTVLNFLVSDIEKTVDSLTEKGIVFEQYDNENLKTNEKGIMHGKGPSIAWFKDPAGNILSVIEEK